MADNKKFDLVAWWENDATKLIKFLLTFFLAFGLYIRLIKYAKTKEKSPLIGFILYLIPFVNLLLIIIDTIMVLVSNKYGFLYDTTNTGDDSFCVIEWFENTSKGVKFLLVFFLGFGLFARIMKFIVSKDVSPVIGFVLYFVPFVGFVMMIIDIITIIMNNKLSLLYEAGSIETIANTFDNEEKSNDTTVDATEVEETKAEETTEETAEESVEETKE